VKTTNFLNTDHSKIFKKQIFVIAQHRKRESERETNYLRKMETTNKVERKFLELSIFLTIVFL
jgi:hypothetical protein